MGRYSEIGDKKACEAYIAQQLCDCTSCDGNFYVCNLIGGFPIVRVLCACLVILLCLSCDSAEPLEQENEQPCITKDKTVVERISGMAVSPAVQPEFPIPTPQQLEWQRDELYLFIHFGINTFTGDEWGDGTASPKVFNPPSVDVDQWVRIAKEGGFKGVILTAKHHEGFALWPTKQSDYSIQQSPWEKGQGDVVKLLAEACRKAGIKFGLYLSPWDRYEPTYGTPAYHDFFVAQLTELLTDYGPVFEVWLDSARDPSVQFEYDFERYFRTIRQLQPDALIANLGPDIRWVGNEIGEVPERQYSFVNDSWWYPVECDVSIRPHWFWRGNEDSKVKSSTELLNLYFGCVGRNGVLLLGTAPNRDGVIPEQDEVQLLRFNSRLKQIFEKNLIETETIRASSERDTEKWGAQHILDASPLTFWIAEEGDYSASIEVSVPSCQSLNIIELKEPIQFGQRIDWHRIEVERGGRWQTVVESSTIGYKRLHQIPEQRGSRLRITVRSADSSPALEFIGAYFSPSLEIDARVRRYHLFPK